MALQKIGLSVFQNLLWVYEITWISVRFPVLNFCPSPPLVVADDEMKGTVDYLF